jgi:hypothetical protein
MNINNYIFIQIRYQIYHFNIGQILIMISYKYFSVTFHATASKHMEVKDAGITHNVLWTDQTLLL